MASRLDVSVPESNFLSRVAPPKPVKLVPFLAGANTRVSPPVGLLDRERGNTCGDESYLANNYFLRMAAVLCESAMRDRYFRPMTAPL